jgi:hypothetical protein
MKMGFPMLWDSAKEIDYPWIEITTRRSIVQKDRDMMMSYMKAYMEATALFKKDREFSKKVIKKVLRVDNEELLNESYDLFAKAFLQTPYPNTVGMKTSFEYVATTRPKFGIINPKSLRTKVLSKSSIKPALSRSSTKSELGSNREVAICSKK